MLLGALPNPHGGSMFDGSSALSVSAYNLPTN